MLDGQPLNGRVLFLRKGGGGFVATPTNMKGEYKLALPLRSGTYSVKIETKTEGIPDVIVGREAIIPAKYNSRSVLVAEIHLGANKVDFELSSKVQEE